MRKLFVLMLKIIIIILFNDIINDLKSNLSKSSVCNILCLR